METDLPAGTRRRSHRRPEPLRDVVDVRFHVAGRPARYDAGLDLAMHDLVVVQTERGPSSAK